MEEEEEEKGGGGQGAQGEVGAGAPLINQSHQLSGLTKTRDPGSFGGWGREWGGASHLRGCEGEKAEMRGSILLRGPASGPSKQQVCVCVCVCVCV